MAYSKYYTGGWVDGSGGGTPITAAALNNLENGLTAAAAVADAAVPEPSSPSSGDGLVWSGTAWVNAKLTNANVDAAAAISYSKLNLAGTIVNNDVSASAAIAASKLAGYPTDATKALFGDGTWKTLGNTTKVAGTYDLNTSTTESSLISGATSSSTTGWQIAANALGATGAVRVTIIGDMVASGATNAVTFKIKFGGTTLWGDARTLLNQATRSPLDLRFVLANVNATNVNYLSGSITRGVSGGGGAAGSIGGLQLYDDSHMYVIPISSTGTSAIDTTAACYLDVTVTHGTSNASLGTRRHYAILEYL